MTPIVPILLLASALSVSAQSTANSVVVESGGKKRVVTSSIPRALEVHSYTMPGRPAFGGGKPPQTTIVQTSELEPKAAEQLREDMAVMARILQRTCAEFASESGRVLGLEILLHGERAQNLYIEDYGALFTLDVDIPLRPSEKRDETVTDKESANEEWESARDELFGNRRPFRPVHPAEHFRREFRAEDVKRLRTELTEALRNAANIRGLKESDWVAVVVRGRVGAGPEGTEGPGVWVEGGELGESGSQMVLRVRKGEIDALAKGLPREEFAKRVLVRFE